MGGDDVRIIEHSRRRPDAKAEAAGAVVIERIIGAVGTLLLVAVGLLLAVNRYEGIAPFVWIEAAGIFVLTVIAVLLSALYPAGCSRRRSSLSAGA